MKNLSKKIGVGVVASSLVVGGAVSTGLVANADSSVNGSQVEQTNEKVTAEQLGDLDLFKALKTRYGFKVIGYNYTDSSSGRKEMKDDIYDLLTWVKGRSNNNPEKMKKIEDILGYKIKNENGQDVLEENSVDVKTEDNHILRFDYATDLLGHLLVHGMEPGVVKAKIGDAETILVFNKKIEADSKATSLKDTYTKYKNKEENSKDPWTTAINNEINNELKEGKLKVETKWLRGGLDIQKDIEEKDSLWILRGDKPDPECPQEFNFDLLELI